MFTSLPLKSQATRIGELLSQHGVTLSRAEKLEALAFVHGAANWQTLRSAEVSTSEPQPAALENTPEFVVQDAAELAPKELYGPGRDARHVTLSGETVSEAAARIFRTTDEKVVWNWDDSRRIFALVAERIVGDPRARTPSVPVVLLDGTYDTWELQHDLSGDTGDFNLAQLERKPFFSQGGVPVFAWNQCQSLMQGETSYIGVLDGRIGVYLEQEYTCRESGDAHPGDKHPMPSFEERVAQLCRTHAPLQSKYPQVSFAVCMDRSITWEGRPCVWAFMPAAAVTPEEAAALTEDLFQLAYPRPLND